MPPLRLPIVGEDNNDWGSILNNYLQQSLDGTTGQLVTSGTNSYTGQTNTNLATNTNPGLVQLAGDLTTPVTAPLVVGIQGNPVGNTNPSDGQVLTWSQSSGEWLPETPSSGGGGGYSSDIDGGNASTTYAAATIIDGGDST